MLIMDLLIPLMMIGFGRMFLNKVPQNINATFGYRTTMSMKNKDTWEFAHKFCGNLWFRCGLVLLPISMIPLILVFSKSIDAIGNTGLIVSSFQLVPVVGSIIPTEIALKKTFDQDGRRKVL